MTRPRSSTGLRAVARHPRRSSTILSQGLHEFLDLIQQQLIAVSRDLSIAFFGYTPEAAQTQTAIG